MAAPAGGQAGSKPDWHENTSAQLSQIQWRPHRYFTRSASTEIVGAAAPAGGPAGSKDTSAQLSKIEWRSASTQQLQKKDRATAAAVSLSLAAVEWGPAVQEQHTGRGKDAFATGAKATKRPLAGYRDRDSDSDGSGKEGEDRDDDGSSPPPVNAFKLLGARYKQVWLSKRPRAEDNRGSCAGGKFDGDRGGDDRIVGQGSVKPNAAQVASPRSTRGYFTRSASTEIVAGAAAPAGGPAGSKDTSAQLSKIEWRSASTQQLQKKDRATAAAASEKGSSVSPRSTHGYFTRSTSAEMVASLDEFLRIL